MMRLPNLRALVGLAVAGMLATVTSACSDAPTAARGERLAPADAPSRTSYTVGDTTVNVFDYNPTTSYDLSFGGGHRLTVPAGAVCDPETSGYGPALWDAPCVPLLRPVTFTVRSWRDAAGHPQITVSPDVRFLPTSIVTLRLKDATATAGNGVILWCPTGALTCVDESLTDLTMTTRSNPNSGFVYRRLKHFSGYTVVVDRYGDGEPTDDGTALGFE